MINDYKIAVVLPAFNASKTLTQTYSEIPQEIVDEIILVDDASTDDTVEIAKQIGITHIIEHKANRGYGGNQKTCYQYGLDLGADIIVMLHPDYQYTPKLIPAMCSLISSGLYEVVFGSRILGNGAMRGGMPLYKYFGNRALTFIQNILIGQKLSEYHTGFRAYSAVALRRVNFEANSDDFVFDNQIISQMFMAGYEIAEITCPTKYFDAASSINFRRSVRYGFGVLLVSVIHWLANHNLLKPEIYKVTS